MIFDSRKRAGQLLAAELKKRNVRPDLVYGLTRGGMAVAAEVAKILGVELRPLIVRKIGPPGNPEFAIGAVAGIPGSQQVTAWWNQDTLIRLGLDEEWQKRQMEAKKVEILKYQHKLDIPEIMSRLDHNLRNFVIADDGAATGISMMAALSAAKNPLGGVAAIKTIVALPVASVDAAKVLRKNADEVVILHIDQYLGAVGAYYRKFEQVSWEKVKQLLKSSYGTNEKIN